MSLYSDEHLRSEQVIEGVIEMVWSCRLVRFPQFHPIDWYAERGGRMIAAVELKTRHEAFDPFGVGYIDHGKWIWMLQAALATPAVYVVQFDDGIRAVDVRQLGSVSVRVAGRKDRGRAADIKPVVTFEARYFSTLDKLVPR